MSRQALAALARVSLKEGISSRLNERITVGTRSEDVEATTAFMILCRKFFRKKYFYLAWQMERARH